ncbi:MFS transporter [Nocardia gipuzkoensis]
MDVFRLATGTVDRATNWVAQQVKARVPTADPGDRDPEFIADTMGLGWLFVRLYFRAEVRGLERVPEKGPVLLVANHSGGNVSPEVLVTTLAFVRRFGPHRPFFQLAHDMVMAYPVIGSLLRRFGTLIGPGVAVGVLALSEVGQRGVFTTWHVLLPLAVAIVLLAAYTAHALRKRATPPLIDVRLFTRLNFSASVVAAALLGLLSFASIFAIPLYYQQVRGFDAWEAGLLLAPFGLGSAIAMPLAGRLSDQLGSRRLALTGAVVALLSALWFTQFDAHTNLWWTALAAFTFGIGTGSGGAPTIGSVYRTLPPELVPQGSSVLYMLNQLGASIGIAMVALIIETTVGAQLGFQHAYWWIAGAAVILIVASSFIPGKPAPVPAEEFAEAETAAPVADRADAIRP